MESQVIWTNSLVPFLRVGVQVVAEGGRLRVSQVFDGRPAKAAGLEVGDIVLECDGRAVTSEEQFGLLIDRHAKAEGPIVFRGPDGRTVRWVEALPPGQYPAGLRSPISADTRGCARRLWYQSGLSGAPPLDANTA